jgi:hypothetical protein
MTPSFQTGIAWSQRRECQSVSDAGSRRADDLAVAEGYPVVGDGIRRTVPAKGHLGAGRGGIVL